MPLSFLDAGQDYVATIYRDGNDAHWFDAPYDYLIETLEVSREQSLELQLAAGGGAAVRFEPNSKADQ